MTVVARRRQESIEVVRSVYDAFARGDLEGVLGHFHPEIVIRQSEELPWGGTYRGREEAVRFFSALTAHIETRIEIGRLVAAGDAVVEQGRTCGRALASGREFAIDEAHVWRLRDGKVVGMEAFVDNGAMLDALAGA